MGLALRLARYSARSGLAYAWIVVIALGAQEPASQPPSAQQRQPTFKSGTNLVRVDVTVTDRSGSPVRDLSVDDFEIMEDGKPQPITSFKLLNATGQPTDDLSLPIRSPEHAAAEAARDDVRVFLIFWDEYHIAQFVSSVRAREQLTRFVLDAFGPTDLVAFMDPLTTLDSIRYTRDRRALAEHVHRLQGRRGVYVPPRSVMEEAHLYNMRDIENIRAQITVGALKGALLHLGSLREGRKTLIFISESLGPLRDQTYTVLSDLMRTANDTNTAIVTVDPRGLQVSRVRGSDSLLSLSAGSGGEAIRSNDLDGSLRRIVRQASAFYLLGYDGSNSPVDGKFHQIKVRVKRGGLEVRARSGYWAPRLSDMVRARETAAAAELPPGIARALADLPAEGSRRPANFWIGTTPRDGGADVTIAWSPRGSVRERTAAAVDVEAIHGSAPVHSGPVEERGLTFVSPPGPLRLTLTVRDQTGEVIDREERTIGIAQPDQAALALSTPMVFRARNPVELRAFADGTMRAVHVGREFERHERMRVRVTVYGRESEGATVSARLLGARGAALSNLPVQPAGSPGTYQVDLAAGSISRGEFVIALLAEKGTARAEEMVAFRVK